MATTNTSSHFFFFGCWNHDNCPPEEETETNKDILNNYLDYRKAIIDIIAKQNFDFGIIAGDNAYAHHNKNYYKKTIDYGFGLLESLNTTLKGALGNHELHHKKILETQLEKSFFHLPSNNYVFYYNNIRIITIDTNLFNEDAKVVDFIHTYYPNSFIIKTLLELFNWLNAEINKPFDGWTIVVGHQPIFSYRPDKLKKSKLLNTKYNKLLDILSQCDKLIYMCADIHHFQAWNIPWKNKNIPMIVAGTGGAKPDSITVSAAPSLTINESKIIGIIPITLQDAYGYCDVTVTDDSMTIEYIPLKCKIKEKVKIDSNKDVLQVKETLQNNYVKLTFISNKNGLEQQFTEIQDTIENCPAQPIKPEQCIDTGSKFFS